MQGNGGSAARGSKCGSVSYRTSLLASRAWHSRRGADNRPTDKSFVASLGAYTNAWIASMSGRHSARKPIYAPSASLIQRRAVVALLLENAGGSWLKLPEWPSLWRWKRPLIGDIIEYSTRPYPMPLTDPERRKVMKQMEMCSNYRRTTPQLMAGRSATCLLTRAKRSRRKGPCQYYLYMDNRPYNTNLVFLERSKALEKTTGFRAAKTRGDFRKTAPALFAWA